MYSPYNAPNWPTNNRSFSWRFIVNLNISHPNMKATQVPTGFFSQSFHCLYCLLLQKDAPISTTNTEQQPHATIISVIIMVTAVNCWAARTIDYQCCYIIHQKHSKPAHFLNPSNSLLKFTTLTVVLDVCSCSVHQWVCVCVCPKTVWKVYAVACAGIDACPRPTMPVVSVHFSMTAVW